MMAGFDRSELEEMVERWVAANDQAGRTGDWSPMAEFYTDDAVYTWSPSEKWEFVARGRDQIREWAYGTEMSGLEQWTYPYVRRLIDDRKGEFVGFWRQLSPLENPEGEPYEIVGTGGSWFRYAGDFKWCWQRDWFDHANMGATFMRMAKNGDLNPVLQERIQKGSKMPGWTPRSDYDWYSDIADIEG